MHPPPTTRGRLPARVIPFAALGAVLLLLLGNGAAAVAALSRGHSDNAAIVRSYAVLGALQETLTTLLNAETGQRGYLLTGHTSYLKPYSRASADIRNRLELARSLTRGDAAMQGQLNRISPMINAKFRELEHTIALYRSGHQAAAVALVRTGQGEHDMTAIRSAVGAMEREERRLLAQREVTASDRLNSVRAAVMIAAGADLLLLGIAAWLLIRLFRGTQARQRAAGERAALLDHLADGVIVTDPSGRITFMNDAAESFLALAWSPRMHVRDLASSPAFDADLEGSRAFADALLARAAYGVEQHLSRPGGEPLILSIEVAELLGDDGGSYGTVATLRDVTERWEMEEQKRSFLEAAAHDLKNPLASIKGLAQLARRRAARLGFPDDAFRERFTGDLDALDRISGRMADLVTELLDVTRGNAEGGLAQAIDLDTVDLVHLVQTVVAELRPSVRGYDLRVDLRADQLTAVVDPVRVQRVIGNLISNAIKYSPGESEVLVRVTREEVGGRAWANITVIDRGLGIPAAEQDRIFDRFYRASNVPAGVEGTGIGLAAARQTAQLLGGDVHLVSREGEGTEVSLRLPLSAEEPAEDEVAS